MTHKHTTRAMRLLAYWRAVRLYVGGAPMSEVAEAIRDWRAA